MLILASDFSGLARLAIAIFAIAIAASGIPTALTMYILCHSYKTKKVLWLTPLVWALWSVVLLSILRRLA
jgi:hypothetical protein